MRGAPPAAASRPVRADPRLRGVRFGERIEVAAWYVLAEALSNVVKHAGASEVEVSLSQQDGRLRAGPSTVDIAAAR